jgi:hypothetical protein
MPRLRANYKFTVFHTYHPFFNPEIGCTDASSSVESVNRGKVSDNDNDNENEKEDENEVSTISGALPFKQSLPYLQCTTALTYLIGYIYYCKQEENAEADSSGENKEVSDESSAERRIESLLRMSVTNGKVRRILDTVLATQSWPMGSRKEPPTPTPYSSQTVSRQTACKRWIERLLRISVVVG